MKLMVIAPGSVNFKNPNDNYIYYTIYLTSWGAISVFSV